MTIELPAAVLWDMDGTLVDTEPLWFAAEFAVVEEHGGQWSEEQSVALICSDLLDAAHVLRAAGARLEPVRIVEYMLEHVVAGVRGDGAVWQPGARELLAELAAAGVPQALVTMSWATLGEAVVERLPAGTFAAVVTGDRVDRGKPHPDPYLLAARELGVDPADAVAIEDSRTGLASAVAAGVPTLVVPHIQPIDPGPGYRVLDSLAGVRAADLLRLRP